MKILDRYTGKAVSDKDLPDQIDFGRFAIINSVTKPTELTYSNFSTNNLILQELLLDKNKSLQDVFVDINIDVQKSQANRFKVIPLIRRIKNKLDLNEFEVMLCENVFHLEEIFRQPHYLLEREIEKVHVSRAKRIPSKSYQYLASHTEDWIHKSIVNFKPSRILNEELDLNFDVYENQFTVTLLERCLIYLNSRLKEIQDIKSFLELYKKLLQNRKDENGWYKKIKRNLLLIGAEYEDENYQKKTYEGSTLSQTEVILNQLNKRLLLLRRSELFDIVNKKTTQALSLRNTNVLVSHKHYRYAKTLWIALDKVKPERNDIEKMQSEQNIFDGVKAYSTALVVYCLQDYLGYSLLGQYSSFTGKHTYYPDVSFNIDTNGILNISIGKQTLKLIVIANEPAEASKLAEVLRQQKAYILYFSEQTPIVNDRIIRINPLDPDSCERMASLLKKYIAKDYLAKLNVEYRYVSILRDFISLIPNDYLHFDNIRFTYRFVSLPLKHIVATDIEDSLESHENYKVIKSRNEKERIQTEIRDLVSQINDNGQKLKKEYLRCMECGQALNLHAVKKLDYLICQQCHNLLDSSNYPNVVLKNNDSKYQKLSESDWGMDYLRFNSEEL